MKNLSKKRIENIYKIAIETYKNNMAKYGKSKTAEYYANQMMLNYENVIVDDDLVVNYYRAGVKELPKFPKYL
jgi:hypothetical protein